MSVVEDYAPRVSIRFGPERVAQLAQLRFDPEPAFGTWGLYDLHTRDWLVCGLANRREAWDALLDLAPERPWDVRIASADADGRPQHDPDISRPATYDHYRTQLWESDGRRAAAEAAARPAPVMRTCPTCNGAGEVRDR